MTSMLLTYFLNYDVSITESRLLEKPFPVHAFFTRKLRKAFAFPKDKKLELSIRRLRVEIPFEMWFQKKNFKKSNRSI